MKPFIRRWFSARIVGTACALCLLAAGPQPADAITVDLVGTPPDLAATVSPNLVLTLDDSGSMANDYMPDFRPYETTNNGWGTTNPWKCAASIDGDVTDPADPRSRSMNGVYFNPNSTYELPQKADGSTLAAPPFTGAWDNGIVKNRPNAPAASTARDLRTQSFCGQSGTNAGAGYFKLKDTVAVTLDANGRIVNPGTTLYVAANWEWFSIQKNGTQAQKDNFAIWYSYYRTRQMAAISSISRAFSPFDENIRVAWQNINSNLINNATKVFKFKDNTDNNNVRTRFYDFLFATPAAGGTPNRSAAKRVGDLFTRAGGAVDTNPYWDRDLNRELTCRQNFHIQMTDGLWNGDAGVTTPSKDTTGRTLPDGTAYSTAAAASKIMWNENAAAANVVTMADIAFHYWATDLRTDLEDTVPPYYPDKSNSLFGADEMYWNPKNDPAKWQHLVQFMIGFGASGTLPNDDATYDKLRRGLLTWPTIDTGTDDGRKIDDMWHAAINSRGSFFTATDPAALARAITDIISSIITRSGSSTAVTVALPIITSSSQGFQASYDTSNWSGQLKKYQLDANDDGEVDPNPTVVWEAGAKLNARDPNSRKIFTWDGASSPRKGVEFRWSNLNTAQQASLNLNPNSATLSDNNGEKRVAWLRGDKTNETTAPLMRSRSSILGAIINSQPVYVSGATSGYEDIFPVETGYTKFVSDVKDRKPTVYVGANDGMLHAFDATSGEERFAYVPNVLFDNRRLGDITNRESTVFRPTVDDMPVVQDVYLRGQWRTVLVGTFRLGGRGVYVLDVTNPETFGTANVLWEFSDKNLKIPANSTSSPVGYTYASANVARIQYQNKWVVLLSTGYYPTSNADMRGNPDPAATDPNAAKTSLLVIDLETGNLIRQIDTSVAPQATGVVSYGLSTPAVYDANNDQIEDVAVAGDLAGNLWRFDLTGDNPSAWTVDLVFKTYTTAPTQASQSVQPISVMPVALRTSLGRLAKPLWVFGTGKYLGKEDRTATGVPSNVGPQAIYGIIDPNVTHDPGYPIPANALNQVKITQAANGERDLTFTTLANARGWKIPLDTVEKGERVIVTATPLYSSNRAILTTIIPQGDDPCKPSRRGSILAIDAATGGSGMTGDTSGPGGRPRKPGMVGDSDAIPLAGSILVLTKPGGGELETPLMSIPDQPYHRGSWRELLDIL